LSERTWKTVTRNSVHEMRHEVGEKHSSEETRDVVIPWHGGFPFDSRRVRDDERSSSDSPIRNRGSRSTGSPAVMQAIRFFYVTFTFFHDILRNT
jgi:hypothetical protein